MLLTGKCVIAGIPLDSVPGEDIKEKRKTLFQSTIDGLRALLDSGGFLVQLTDDGALVIPTGYVTITATTETAIGLRWSISGDERDADRAAHALGMLLDVHPEMRNPSLGHAQLHEWLTSE